MVELYYDSYSVAYFAVSQEMGSKTQLKFMDELYDKEHEFLHPLYKENKRSFVSDVLYWTTYLTDKEKLDAEFPAIEKDFKALGRRFIHDRFMSDYPDFDMFFMIMRLRIVFSEEKKYVRMKLRTLLKNYGYRRRSDAITSHIRDCLMFYHIQPYLRDGVECDIRKISIDDMISFRTI